MFSHFGFEKEGEGGTNVHVVDFMGSAGSTAPRLSMALLLEQMHVYAEVFTGRSAEAGLDLTLSVTHSVSQQTPNEPLRDF